ncbi:hypothetical protein HVTV-2_gp162 [Haloarcula virus HVTV-2]|uniref:Uncharacterized protein n=1 Tax=Haloarcula vallismortis tailed virus 1 TaxID=1262528 RepID=L7TH33_9CAUD|nr:hypothetical protein HVTV1_160 [Haloarcula vallismortis tailed virus 1]AGC34529.1 hypothetical protein HVTV1_160 [Haloarcula vallismortis tailed virus 1]UBF22969.1 hypothetical protein HVTV-2_gp162 [Haloarcula virus HVTV-2]
MSDGISRRELKKAIEEASENMARSAWQDATISVSKDTHDALRKEAGLDPSHPGYEWDDTRSNEFWDRRMP